jgi:hypothetical protein
VSFHSTARGRVFALFGAILPTRRRDVEPQPEHDRTRAAWAFRHKPLTAKARTARRDLVVRILREAAWNWAGETTLPLRRCFERALTDYMAEVAPQVTVRPYDYGRASTDEAYRAIEKAALFLAFVEWENDRATAAESAALDDASDRLDEALEAYIAAASAG